jgi:hypothetical protein
MPGPKKDKNQAQIDILRALEPYIGNPFTRRLNPVQVLINKLYEDLNNLSSHAFADRVESKMNATLQELDRYIRSDPAKARTNLLVGKLLPVFQKLKAAYLLELEIPRKVDAVSVKEIMTRMLDSAQKQVLEPVSQGYASEKGRNAAQEAILRVLKPYTGSLASRKLNPVKNIVNELYGALKAISSSAFVNEVEKTIGGALAKLEEYALIAPLKAKNDETLRAVFSIFQKLKDDYSLDVSIPRIEFNSVKKSDERKLSSSIKESQSIFASSRASLSERVSQTTVVNEDSQNDELSKTRKSSFSLGPKLK